MLCLLERFRAINKLYYRNAAAGIVVYDITNRVRKHNKPANYQNQRLTTPLCECADIIRDHEDAVAGQTVCCRHTTPDCCHCGQQV